MHFGKKLKAVRLKRGMTQKELGIEVGFPESNAAVRIAQYEQKERTPKKEILNKLAKALKVSPYWFSIEFPHHKHNLLFFFFEEEDHYTHLDLLELEDGRIAFVMNFETDQEVIREWHEVRNKYLNKEITKLEYDNWKLSWINDMGKGKNSI